MSATKRKRGAAAPPSSSPTESPITPRRRRRAAPGNEDEEQQHSQHDEEGEGAEEQPSTQQRSRTLQTDTNIFEIRVYAKANAANSSKRRQSAQNWTQPVEDADIAGVNGLRCFYSVHPADEWLALTKYRNVVIAPQGEEVVEEQHKYQCGDYVFVNHQINPDAKTDDDESGPLWIAQIREVRAASPAAVFARVAWMYWPQELPSGRQKYHGKEELVASNHMDIIDAMTICGKAGVVYVNQSLKRKERDMSQFGVPLDDAFCWRQTLNVVAGNRLSALPRDCRCGTVSNLDERLFQCPHAGCRQWFHERCLKEEALRRYAQQASLKDGSDKHKGSDETESFAIDPQLVATAGTEEQDSITVSSPARGGFLSGLRRLMTTSPNKNSNSNNVASSATDKITHAVGSGLKKRPLKRQRTKSTSKASSVSTLSQGINTDLAAELDFDGDRFTGRFNIFRALSGSEEKQQLIGTIEAYCLSGICGKSLADETALKSLSDTIRTDFDNSATPAGAATTTTLAAAVDGINGTVAGANTDPAPSTPAVITASKAGHTNIADIPGAVADGTDTKPGPNGDLLLPASPPLEPALLDPKAETA